MNYYHNRMDLVPTKGGHGHIKDISPGDKRALIRTGQKSLEENPFFQFIDIIMNDEKTRQYIDKFFGDWDDVKTTVMVMKTYQIIDDELKRLELSKRLKMSSEARRRFMIGLIKELMNNGDCRQELVQSMNTFMNGDYMNCRRLVQTSVPAEIEPVHTPEQ